MPTVTKRNTAALAVLLALVCTLIGLASPVASAQSASDENALFNATNQSRAANGLPALQYDPALSQISNAWASQMAGTQWLSHNPDLVSQVNSQVTTQWTRLGENVGYGPDVASLEQAFMNSAPHRANILGDYNRVGVGATRDGNGTLWVAVNFVKGPAIATYDPPGTVHSVSWFLRNSPSAGPADRSFAYGANNYQYVSGDWNGDGTQTIGVYVNGNWYLRNSSSGGPADISFAFGGPGDTPVVGDWNGDGTDTIGVYVNGWWYLRNRNSGGPPDATVNYGGPGYTPVVGAWAGGAVDGIGVYVDGWWYLRNTPAGGAPDKSVDFGGPGYAPVVGEWTANGPTGIGVVAGS